MWWLWRSAVFNAYKVADDGAQSFQKLWYTGRVEAEELWALGITSVLLICFWLAVFYGACWTYPRWNAGWPASTKQHENSKYWGAWYFMGTIHAIIVSCICVPAFFLLWSAPHAVQYGHTQNVGFCVVGANEASYGQAARHDLLWVQVAVAFAGLIFTCFICVDLVVAVRHELAAWDYILHHAIFIFAGQMIRGYCMLPFNAAILMAMEASTPFLNFYLYFRNRQGYKKKLVEISSHLFALSFFSFRVGINTYGAYYLWIQFDRSMPSIVPVWQQWFLLIAISAGAALQWFWAYKIVNSIICPALNNKEEDEAERRPLKGQSV